MSSRASLDRINSVLKRLERRIRRQRALDAMVTGLTLSALVAMLALVLYKTGWIGVSAFGWAALLSLAVPLTFSAWRWTRPVDRVALAQRLDRSHHLHDRLSTAVSLAEDGDEENPFSDAQLRDAARHVEGVELGAAAPTERPTDLAPLVVVFLALGALVFVRPPSDKHPLPPPFEVQHDPVLDSATVALERDRLEDIKQQLEEIEDREAQELVEEIEALLDAVEDRELSERQFLEELDRIEKKFFEKQGKTETEKLADKLKEAAEKMEEEAGAELEKSPETKAVVDALKKKDLDKAASALEKLAEKMAKGDMSEKEMERMADLMRKLASSIDPTDPELQKMLEKHRDLVDKLSKAFENQELSREEEQRLNRAKKELKNLEKRQKRQQQSKSNRELKRLQRSLKEFSDEAEKVVQGKGDRKPNSEEKGSKKGEKKSDFENEAGRKGKKASKQMKQGGKNQKADAAKKMARRQLEELREAMRRAGKSSSSRADSSRKGQQGKPGEEGQKGEKRGEQIKEFLRRAKGKKAAEEQKQGTRPGEGKQEQREGGEKGNAQRPSQQARGKGGQKGQSGRPAENQRTNSAGKGKGDGELGEETELDSKRKDVKVEGKAGEGPSRSEIIRSASEEGFANTEYKDVYVDYESVAEEVMEKENVPDGYRFYIKRYFQLIKPQQGE